MAAFKDLPDDTLLGKTELVRRKPDHGIVPHGKTDWDKRVKAGKAPAPIYPFGPHKPLWTAGSIRAYLAKLNQAA